MLKKTKIKTEEKRKSEGKRREELGREERVKGCELGIRYLGWAGARQDEGVFDVVVDQFDVMVRQKR